MADGAVCRKCHKGRIQNGKCTVCGFKEERDCSINALPRGQRLCGGRYSIEGVLGGGGYGITYEAWDFQERRRIALKEFFPAFALRRSQNGIDTVCVDPKAEAALAHARIRFHEEAGLLLSLRNVKEIVDVFHSFEDNHTAYYTMELLQGIDMQKRLKTHGRMTWFELRPILMQIIRALYATHQAGYIHRDISPDNIFLLDDGTARLIDFGNARRYRANQQLTAVVKEKFAPREQYNRRGNQGPWTDIYSLCVTIYYAMTGVLPPKATERSPYENPLSPLHTICTDVPEAVSNAVQIGMSPEENKRYRSVADFAYAMFPGQAILGDMVFPVPRRDPPSQMYRRTEPPRAFQQQGSKTMPVPQKPAMHSRANHSGSLPPGDSTGPMLICVQGIMKGFRTDLPIGQVQYLGRGAGKQIQYPEGASGVSRNQCSFLLQANGAAYVRDDNSSYGTSVNGYRLAPLQWKALKRGDRIAFGKEIYLLR